MPEPLFRIKPLVWTKCGKAYEGSHPLLRAGYYWVDHIAETGTWRWGLYISYGTRIYDKKGFETLEAAQASADEHNRQQMMLGLERMYPTFCADCGHILHYDSADAVGFCTECHSK